MRFEFFIRVTNVLASRIKKVNLAVWNACILFQHQDLIEKLVPERIGEIEKVKLEMLNFMTEGLNRISRWTELNDMLQGNLSDQSSRADMNVAIRK